MSKTDLVAVVAVLRDFDTSLGWVVRLFGSPAERVVVEDEPASVGTCDLAVAVPEVVAVSLAPIVLEQVSVCVVLELDIIDRLVLVPGVDLGELRRGYLLGWANSGFDEETIFYIDNVEFHDTDIMGTPAPNPPTLEVQQ